MARITEDVTAQDLLESVARRLRVVTRAVARTVIDGDIETLIGRMRVRDVSATLTLLAADMAAAEARAEEQVERGYWHIFHVFPKDFA